MQCLFIGGPLDGELREVEVRSDLKSGWQPYIAGQPAYHISNGIARHESVSEEEVARRVHGWMATWRSEPMPSVP